MAPLRSRHRVAKWQSPGIVCHTAARDSRVRVWRVPCAYRFQTRTVACGADIRKRLRHGNRVDISVSADRFVSLTRTRLVDFFHY